MATILFEGTEFEIHPELTAARVLGAACIRYADPGDCFRFKLFDERGREVTPSELVGEGRLALCDVRKLVANRSRPINQDYRLTAGGK
jgi:hypothetical protein